MCSGLVSAEERVKTVLIGANGNKGRLYYNLLKDSVNFVGFIHPKPRQSLQQFAKKEHVSLYPNIQEALVGCDFDAAIIAVPHYLHFDYTKELLDAHKCVIKEKPITMNKLEATDLLEDIHSPLFVVVQRQFQNSFIHARELLSKIGEVCSFTYKYNLSIKGETSGWRAEKEKCLGGVLLDMGYHVVDIVTSFFGAPDDMYAKRICKTELMKQEDLEDQMFIVCSYKSGLVGNIVLSRIGVEKEECFEISGTKGTIKVSPRTCYLFDSTGNVVQKYSSSSSKNEEIVAMFKMYLKNIDNQAYIQGELNRHIQNISIIDALYNLSK